MVDKLIHRILLRQRGTLHVFRLFNTKISTSRFQKFVVTKPWVQIDMNIECIHCWVSLPFRDTDRRLHWCKCRSQMSLMNYNCMLRCWEFEPSFHSRVNTSPGAWLVAVWFLLSIISATVVTYKAISDLANGWLRYLLCDMFVRICFSWLVFNQSYNKELCRRPKYLSA